ncbi:MULTISPECIES: crossover junction endodeoxyribonuclease RuvC [Caloramator]|uniref:Crossover junction endodeoxyribonuclease RuvC n=1 Tax=Caloramator proteoclasticus DSM 10124 TaxID=1121262 RepID=A0A1M4WT98_9CLOT|nr:MULTISPECIES: crossover junction endodeoxyribonuclease RuvC [Caloramator]SHE84459.1 Holliday junction endonuclease RuvC [Caloramator proteoclasticus DSM 10124]
MIILGLDPGIAIVGIGIIEFKQNKFSVLDYRAITTTTKNNVPQRLEIIYDELNEIIKTYNPDAFALEELFFNQNAKTAITVGQARGVAVLAAQKNKIPIYEYTPLQVKQAVVGYGRADKKQIQQMVKVLLNLKEIPKPDDVADALAIAICHAHTNNMSNFFMMR